MVLTVGTDWVVRTIVEVMRSIDVTFLLYSVNVVVTLMTDVEVTKVVVGGDVLVEVLVMVQVPVGTAFNRIPVSTRVPVPLGSSTAERGSGAVQDFDNAP